MCFIVVIQILVKQIWIQQNMQNLIKTQISVLNNQLHVYALLNLSSIFQCLNVKFFAMHKVQMHAGAIMKLAYGFASVPDNPLAKVRGLSSRTDAQNIQYITLI